MRRRTVRGCDRRGLVERAVGRRTRLAAGLLVPLVIPVALAGVLGSMSFHSTAAAAPRQQTQADYIVTDLGTLGGTISGAWGINNVGQIVGRAYLPGDVTHHAFIYQDGVMTDLGTIGPGCNPGNSWAFDVNDSGQVAGWTCSGLAGGFTRAFRWSGGVMTDLGTFGGSGSAARGINNAGDVVGNANLPGDGTTHPFVYRDGEMHDLGTLPGTANQFGYANHINENGNIVGYADVGYWWHGFLYMDGTMIDLTRDDGYAWGINDADKVVGQAYHLVGGVMYHNAFLYSNGVMTNLGYLPPSYQPSVAISINNHDQIVGYNGSSHHHAFLYENGAMTDLNDLIPDHPEWELNWATSINDVGQIVGFGTIGGQTHGFLLTPKTRILSLAGDLDFGQVSVGRSATATLTISNSGTDTLTVTGISYPSGFSGNWAGSIGPGDSHAVTVTFTPVAAATYTGTVVVAADQTSGANTIAVSGTGVHTRGILVTGNLAFGALPVGTTATRTLTIANTGIETLTVTGITYPAGFSGAWSGAVPVGGSHDVVVTFAPTSAMAYVGTVTVLADHSGGTDTIPASGTGITRLISLGGSLAFGGVSVGTTAIRTLTIGNTGTSALSVTGISYPEGFSGAWSGAIPPGGSQTVTVTFAPTTPTTYGGTATVTANHTGGTNTILVSGMGCACTLTPPMQIAAAQGATSSVTVTTTAACGWAAASDASWLTVTSVPSGTGAGTVTLSAAANLQASARIAHLTVGGQTATIAQAGSGSGWLWWEHQTSGALRLWLMDGNVREAETAAGSVADTNWQIVGTADVNQDGHGDLLWQHQGDGRIAVWMMHGDRTLYGMLLSPDRVSDLNWKIRGVADFNGDGQADLLWQHRVDGRIAVWLMNGTASMGGIVLARMTNPAWRIAAAGDVNGDGQPDIVWQNDTDGRIAAWFIANLAVAGTPLLTPAAVADLQWKIRGATDVDGDGQTDLLWQHETDGRIAAWLMDGTALRTGLLLQPGRVDDLAWRMVGAK